MVGIGSRGIEGVFDEDPRTDPPSRRINLEPQNITPLGFLGWNIPRGIRRCFTIKDISEAVIELHPGEGILDAIGRLIERPAKIADRLLYGDAIPGVVAEEFRERDIHLTGIGVSFGKGTMGVVYRGCFGAHSGAIEYPVIGTLRNFEEKLGERNL